MKNIDKRVKRQITGREQNFFAIFQPGFEEQVEGELRQFGINKFVEKTSGGIEFQSKLNEV